MQQRWTDCRLGIVDDDASIRETLAGFLEAEGYHVRGAADAVGLERMMRTEPLDLVLLDIRLPGTDGLTLTRSLREKSELGIILITGRNDKVDRILGLEYGADDYIAKPIDERELLPRVRNLLRRVSHSRLASPTQTLHFDRYTMDMGRRAVTDDGGQPVSLTTAEFDLLSVFVRNSGQVMSRERLIAAASHRRWDPFDRTIDTLVRRLRRKLEANPERPSLITTVHGAGYLFSA
ncbi:response regulator [Chelatococcus reniformis]|uniref:Regulatory protein VirG n=1 Tax=Chelatococcus reniformis TaxID=1494448 RepID=A0A916XME5_9HYPH|nr:response regulator [Chelatococcus reniformis]GGC86509.1 transcriptional regulatory protein AruR [Chelatococcus reniformis]